LVFGGPKGQGPAAAGGAAAISRLVTYDAQQPGPKWRAGPEAIKAVVRLEEPVLGSVLGLGGVAGDAQGGAYGLVPVALYQLLVGSLIARLGAANERGVVKVWLLQHTGSPPFYNGHDRLVPTGLLGEPLIERPAGWLLRIDRER
jgi:hypothetical protein